MKLDEALAVWAYMQHQYQPSTEARRAADDAWQVICQEANRIIYQDPTAQTQHEIDRDEALDSIGWFG